MGFLLFGSFKSSALPSKFPDSVMLGPSHPRDWIIFSEDPTVRTANSPQAQIVVGSRNISQ